MRRSTRRKARTGQRSDLASTNSPIRHVRKEIGTPLNSGVLLLPFVIGLLLFEILRSNNVDLPHLAPDEGGGGLCGGLPHEMYYNIVTAVASRSLVQPCRGNSAGLFYHQNRFFLYACPKNVTFVLPQWTHFSP